MFLNLFLSKKEFYNIHDLNYIETQGSIAIRTHTFKSIAVDTVLAF